MDGLELRVRQRGMDEDRHVASTHELHEIVDRAGNPSVMGRNEEREVRTQSSAADRRPLVRSSPVPLEERHERPMARDGDAVTDAARDLDGGTRRRRPPRCP